ASSPSTRRPRLRPRWRRSPLKSRSTGLSRPIPGRNQRSRSRITSDALPQHRSSARVSNISVYLRGVASPARHVMRQGRWRQPCPGVAMRQLKLLLATLWVFHLLAGPIANAADKERSVTGVVKDALGRPLEGVATALQSRNGRVMAHATTDKAGHFEFR